MKAIVSLSGGMDSATVLARALADGREVTTVGFRYGSKHNCYENRAALKLAEHYRVPFHLIDLVEVMRGFRSNLLQGQGDIPEGHYESESMKLTVVPGRNTIFASILLGLAQSIGAGEVWLGVHAGDHAIYPDCRPLWVDAVGEVFEVASEGTVRVVAPFLQMTKVGILSVGLALGVPYQTTRTCYKEQELSCGKCGSCQERLEAFAKNGTADPLSYETTEVVSTQ